ncbi:MAG: chloramphenicol acetyltransferase [Saprospiraceae bacterium]|nr:chloramphenicol acetyltransferase [Saprospiraceae bacterium]
MYKKIDVEHWNRKELFYFFNTFEEPYFGITANLDVTIAYQKSKALQTSFFLYYLHKSLLAVNQLNSLKYRILENDVVQYDTIHSSATVNREDGTFGYSFMIFDSSYETFHQHAKSEIDRVRSSKNLFPERNGLDAIHYSSLPWLRFTSLSHVRRFAVKDSVPKISFGKMLDINGKKDMPCSIHVHHGLVDGKDVGDYFELFQELLNEK